MSESMVERVARALTTADGDDPDGKTGSLLNENEVWWQHRVLRARAAIEAMREPTGDMRIAGAHVHDQRPSEVASTFRAMIDAALTPAKVDEAG